MELDLKLVKAAAICASKEETRYYLKGVAIQASAKGVFIVATDGHRLAAFKQLQGYDGESFNIIIPLDIIAKIKLNKKDPFATLKLADGLLNQWSITHDGSTITFSVIDGTFPDWQRIIPSELNGKTAQFNMTYLGDFAKVAKALTGSETSVSIAHNGDGPALLSFGDEVDGLGVLMPFRKSIQVKTPNWVTA